MKRTWRPTEAIVSVGLREHYDANTTELTACSDSSGTSLQRGAANRRDNVAQTMMTVASLVS